MKTLTSQSPEVIAAYKSGNDTEKNLLNKLYGDINTENSAKAAFEAYVKEHKLKCSLPYSWDEYETDDVKKGIMAFAMLQAICSNENGSWKADWFNSNQRKWYPYFEMFKSGLGFSYTYYDRWLTTTSVGSRLCYASEDLAEKKR